MNRIHYLKREAIDTDAWDHCIRNAREGRIYATSAWLDAMATNWDALVWNDYAGVLPLPWRVRLGVRYLYPPFLTAQLGPIGDLPAGGLKAVLDAVPAHFQYWDLPLNKGALSAEGYAIQERINYALPLGPSYEALRSGYRENIRRNVAKSRQSGCQPVEQVSLDEVIPLAMAAAPDGYIHDKDIRAFKKNWARLEGEGRARAFGIRASGGQLLASAAFVYDDQRAYYLLVGNHPNGRTLGASHALIDGFISLHAGQELILDFEGSDLRNLAFFYSSFGAREERYGWLRLNRLPFYLRWLKR